VAITPDGAIITDKAEKKGLKITDKTEKVDCKLQRHGKALT